MGGLWLSARVALVNCALPVWGRPWGRACAPPIRTGTAIATEKQAWQKMQVAQESWGGVSCAVWGASARTSWQLSLIHI